MSYKRAYQSIAGTKPTIRSSQWVNHKLVPTICDRDENNTSSCCLIRFFIGSFVPTDQSLKNEADMKIEQSRPGNVKGSTFSRSLWRPNYIFSSCLIWWLFSVIIVNKINEDVFFLILINELIITSHRFFYSSSRFMQKLTC